MKRCVSRRHIARALLRGAWLGVLSAALLSSASVRAEDADRAKALSAIGAARNALVQLDGGTAPDEARAKLDEAQALFDAQKYVDAAAAADAAWKLVSSSTPPGTSFTVEVKPDGFTKVTSKKGQPVRVEAQGVQREVKPGNTVAVARGDPPIPQAPEAPPLAVPAALSPRPHAKLRLRPDNAGNVGPLKLTWKKCVGATGYRVVLLPEKEGEKEIVLTSAKPEVVVRSLRPGRYAWRVTARAVGERESEPSEPRLFEVEAARIKLEVRGTDWK